MFKKILKIKFLFFLFLMNWAPSWFLLPLAQGQRVVVQIAYLFEFSKNF